MKERRNSTGCLMFGNMGGNNHDGCFWKWNAGISVRGSTKLLICCSHSNH